MNENVNRGESYQRSIGGNLHVEVENFATAIGVAEKGVDEFGRLTEEGARNFAELTDKLGREELKKQQNIQKQTDRIQKDLNKAFSNLAKRIPIIGKDLEKGFEKMMKSMTVKMDKLLTMTWGRLGAGMKGAMKIGAGGIVAAGALVLKQFNEIEKATVGLSKQTGLTGKNLKSLSRSMKTAQNDSYQFGITMQESADATAAMVTSLGGFAKVSPQMVKNATLLAKFTGLSAEAAAKFQGDMIKAFGMTSKDVMRFQNAVKDIATRSGVNARKVVADIMQDTQLSAMYMSRGEEYLKRSAIQAAKLGKSMKDTAAATKMFLDIDTSAEIVGELNQYMGSTLNSLELFNLAATGDTEAVINRLGQAFSNPRGMAFIEQMPGLAEKFGKKLGFTLKEMRIMANLEKEVGKEIDHQAAKHESIAESVAKQQTTFNQISNQFKQDVFPIANDLAGTLLNITKAIGPGNIKTGMVIAAAVGLAGFATKLALGTTPMTAMWVRGVGGGDALGGIGGGQGRSGSSKTSGGWKARAASAAKGGMKSNLLMSALMLVPSLIQAWNSKDIKKALPGLLAVGGSFIGAGLGGAVGALFGGAGAVPGAFIGRAAGGALGHWAGSAIQGAAKGAVVSKPTLFMAGEEGLPEMIIPTGRISKGMPINKDVSQGLAGMGVPGFVGGRYGAVRGLANQQQAAAAARTAQRTQMGSMADPQTQRVRQIQYEQEVQKRKADQRASMRLIEEKSLDILEEERSIASNVGGPIGNFAKKLGLWQKAKEAAAAYAKKTADRFWDNMAKNNGNVMQSLKDTWGQTVGDLKQLQARLFTKLGDFARNMVARGSQWIEGKVKQLGTRALNWGMDKLGISNEFNRQQFSSSLISGGRQLGGYAMRRSGMVRNVVGSLQQKYGQVKAFGGQLDTGKVASAGQTMMAGAGGIARGDYAGAGKAMLMQEAKSRVGSKIAQLGGGAKLGGGYAAAATGAMQGIASGDIKAAGKGALEGAVGYGLGVAATTALAPFMGPAAGVIGPMIGSIVAGPATKGIMAGANQSISGIKNIFGGIRGGSFKQFGSGVLSLAKGAGGYTALKVAGKELGAMVGIKAGARHWSASEARAKSVSQMMQAQRSGGKALITQGGVFTTSKWKEGMAKAVKLGDKGPNAQAMQTMVADIVRVFGVTPDIAQGFIYAALGASMPEDQKSQIENEITGGWGKKVKGGGWQADYQAGKTDQNWKQIRSKMNMGRGDEASGLAQAHAAGQKLDRARAAAAGGFTSAELKDLGMRKSLKDGTGVTGQGNVYLDGVLVGVVAGSAAAGAAVDGLPTALYKQIS